MNLLNKILVDWKQAVREKNTWLTANKDTASVELIFKKKDELYEALHYIFLNLKTWVRV